MTEICCSSLVAWKFSANQKLSWCERTSLIVGSTRMMELSSPKRSVNFPAVCNMSGTAFSLIYMVLAALALFSLNACKKQSWDSVVFSHLLPSPWSSYTGLCYSFTWVSVVTGGTRKTLSPQCPGELSR